MPGTLLEAYKESLASVNTTSIPLMTLQFSHATLADVFIVHATKNWRLTLEDGTTQEFLARPFSLIFGSIDKNSNPNFSLQVDNVDLSMMNLIRQVQESGTEVMVKARPYLSSDTTKPQITKIPALRLSDARISKRVLQARLAYPEISNRKTPRETYTTSAFPGL